jgi:predicted nucleic acid-binding protein
LSLMETSEANATCSIAYVECRSAFARREQEGTFAAGDHVEMLRSLDDRWEELVVVALDAPLVRAAGDLATERVLRAADALHLAAAKRIADASLDRFIFGSWDRRLWDAAVSAGLEVSPNVRP